MLDYAFLAIALPRELHLRQSPNRERIQDARPKPATRSSTAAATTHSSRDSA